ncbi:hypothetical protein V1264_020249 [Littorina saxatilis]|uniref:C2H2-type domain-containing protein n=1 Tax=Littorina saxatilis TaxID=31220 RepID=A0AAN9B9R3_9CAEN
MRDSKTAFSPVVIKQEPRDLSEDTFTIPSDTTTTTTTTANNNGNDYDNTGRLLQDRATNMTHKATAMSRSSGGETSEAVTLSRYSSSHEFVAEIARRVREESNSSNSLRGLELTPVTGLGHLTDLKASSLALYTTPPLAPQVAAAGEGRGKSRGEYACSECSSRFDTARDFRAHCLTHQVMMAESKLRRTRGGGVVLMGGVGGEEERVEDSEEVGSVFGGPGPGAEGASFTCEDCDTRFSSRDTYAMHMLIRAKNEACFPRRSLTTTTATSNSSTTPTLTHNPTTSNNNSKDHHTDTNNHHHHNNLPPSSPVSSLTGVKAALNLSTPALLLATSTPPELKHEPTAIGGGELSGGRSDGGRHSMADPTHQLIGTLGVEVGRMADYSPAWWSKYVPWVTGAGLLGGAGAEGEGPALPMVCYLCGEMFSNRDSLAMHVLFHTRDTPPASVGDLPSLWRKPLPSSLSSLPSHSPLASSSAMQLMGQAALRQLQQQHQQQRSPFSHSHNPNPFSRQLSPTEAAVASAAAAAVAAVTPPRSYVEHLSPPPLVAAGTRSDPSLPCHNGLRGRFGEDSDRVNTKEPTDSRTMTWATSGMTQRSAVTEDVHHTLPQRGASAPLTGNPTLSIWAGSKSPFRSISDLNSQETLEKSRPLSADHVVLRRHKPLLDLRQTGDVTEQWKVPKDSASNGDVWHNGSDTPIHHHSSAFNVYRLQRLKKLRLAKGVYRRPGARGRPPMTIYGTTGRQPAGVPPPQHNTSSADPLPSSTLASSTSSNSSHVSSMVKALTSQGHEVSACSHCELLFGDRTLYQLHMGLHNVNNPWQCNACGFVCSSRLHFATHTLHY